jgi:putative membrane protein
MAEYYNFLKSLHLIFVVTWFAGLFYIPRLFIYHIEAKTKSTPEYEVLSAQFRIMERRLWKIITWPSAILCTLAAIGLLLAMPVWLTQGWMHVKLAFVLLLWGYHLMTHRMYLKFQSEIHGYSSQFMRIWNEGATIVLFAVIFLVIYKTAIDWMYGFFGLLGLIVLLTLGIKLYKALRRREGDL